MSNSKMLIDASHPEETRVVVLKGNRVEEFDFESASKKQLRGNIYLAKVTRVEPSLQAAFVEYGGNRHGFLAFSEIHPDYYQIPFADRQALLEEEARAHRDEDDEPRGEGRSESRGNGENRNRDGRRGGGEGRRNAEGRGTGETRSSSEGGERQARGEGQPRADGQARGDRNERGGRNERGQRRSRRHRRDGVQTSAFDRAGSVDESVSEPAFELDGGVALTDTAPVSHDDTGFDASSTETEHTERYGVPEGADGEERTTETTAAVDSFADVSSAETAEPIRSEDHGADEPIAVEAPAVEPVTGSDENSSFELLSAVDHAETTVAHETAEVHSDEIEAATDAPTAAFDHSAPTSVGEGEGTHEGFETSAEPGETASTEAHHGSDAVEARDHHDEDSSGNDHEEEHVEQIGGDALSDVAPRPVRLRRHYKIQEVIKRRQILLIQVVKEERGNKGAALTTYLSLAGRYSVLMPNTAKGGGISRKITDGEDRKRLKAIAGELEVPEGMGVILRTAGASRSPIEVKRDFEYLLRMWESVRELTLKSSAPTLVYEEGSLIKRSIRDLYSKEVEEIVVSGEAGFSEARDFMRMLMPGNVKSVQSYRDPQPIFAKSGVEAQLDAMFSPHVTLKSGGYLVINQTEALVAIDVNSGRSTREHNIEDTALRTNLEAADEVARQLRLRDLAGLIVVDFIDMEEGRNNRAVERRIKEALKNDRARIQIGRISHFGLLEMSRQRIRTGVLEGSTVVCSHCAGAGTVRSTASIALHVLRLVEDALIKDASYDLIVRSRGEVALYMLNQKRAKLVELEQRFGVTLTVAADETLTGMVYHAIDRGELATPAVAPLPRQDLVRVDSIPPIFEPGSEIEDEIVDTLEVAESEDVEGTDDAVETGASAEHGDSDGRRRKRRRRRRGRDRDGASEISADAPQPSDEGLSTMAEISGDLTHRPESGGAFETAAAGSDAHESPNDAPVLALEPVADDIAATMEPAAEATAEPVDMPAAVDASVVEAPKRRRSRRTVVPVEKEVEVSVAPVANGAEAEPAAPPRRRRPSRARVVAVETAEVPAEPAPAEAEPLAGLPAGGPENVEHPVETSAPELPVVSETTGDAAPAELPAVNEPVPAPEPDPDRPKRSGWWQRAKASFGS